MDSEHKPIVAGDEAPDFTLPAQNREPVHLADFRGKSAVVLFFYPMDYSPICTLEAIAFRETYRNLVEAGAEVIGVSDDPPESHRSFCERLRLPFRIVTDEGHRVRDHFGARIALGIPAPRVTYVIDKLGVVRGTFVATFGSKKHALTALELVRQLA